VSRTKPEPVGEARITGGFIQAEAQQIEVVSIDRGWRGANDSVLLRVGKREQRLRAGDSLALSLDLEIPAADERA
jgi:hypothetical protein